MSGFSHFPPVTLSFLKGITAHNDKAWFDAHRADYEAGYVDSGRQFVEAVGERLKAISPAVQFSPKINGSIMRINRDIRFSKDKSPYKTHLDLWFWHGERKGWTAPGFYLRITPEIIYLGTGMHGFDKPWLSAFRDAVVDEAQGKRLAETVAQVEAAGPYEVGGATRKRVPQGIPLIMPAPGSFCMKVFIPALSCRRRRRLSPGSAKSAFIITVPPGPFRAGCSPKWNLRWCTADVSGARNDKIHGHLHGKFERET